MEYNPLIFDECMRYISENKITFDKSVDVLIKQDMNILSEVREERNRAFENAEKVLEFYREFYEKRMVRASRMKTYLMGIDFGSGVIDWGDMDDEDIMDEIKALETGYDEYEDYRDSYESEKAKVIRKPNKLRS